MYFCGKEDSLGFPREMICGFFYTKRKGSSLKCIDWMGLKSSEKRKKRKENSILAVSLFGQEGGGKGEGEGERGRERRGYYHENGKRKEERLLNIRKSDYTRDVTNDTWGFYIIKSEIISLTGFANKALVESKKNGDIRK